MCRLLFKIFLITIFIYSVSSAGQISGSLQDRIDKSNSNEMIEVWIKLPDVTDKRSLARSSAMGLSKADKNERVISHLKDVHSNSQKNLISELKKLEVQNRVSNLESFWISNIVSAKINSETLKSLISRNDIEFIIEPPVLKSIPIERVSPAAALSTATVESNLVSIKADQAWAAGYTGEGRLVCSFDTGVQGNHPALVDSWKGQDGDSAAAWFDPIFEQPFPHTQSGNLNHGTHVMGILVGHDDNSGDTVGVAPDAKWISAAVIDVGANAALRAFEWAMNPDGNPNTVDDVPDVINHSWGFDEANWSITCQDIFYSAIEATEAIGIVNIFAAGNSGASGPSTIVNPANYGIDSISGFAVGNLNHVNDTIVVSSSRGPSLCSGGGTKPNVVAPGNSIRSTWPGSTYFFSSGTSMAAPHVAGLVALLRQKNPNTTVEEIKNAILTSTSTHANFGVLPNNTYGWGKIDCMSALNAISSPLVSTKVRIYSFDHALTSPGDTIRSSVVAEILGDDVVTLTGSVIGSDPSLSFVSSSNSFGSALHGDTVRSSDSIVVAVSDTVTPGRIISVDYQFATNGYVETTKLHFIIGEIQRKSNATHNTGQIEFSLTNFGLYGLGPGSFVPGPGVGFSWNGTSNELFEAGLMVGKSVAQVSSAVHSFVFEPLNDFAVADGGSLQFVSPGPAAFEQTFGKFTDSNSPNPIGLEITQETFADTGLNSDFIIMRFIMRNISGVSQNNIYLGLYFNWDAGGAGLYTQSAGGYDFTDQFLWMAYNNGGSLEQYRGMKVIQGQLATALTERAALLTEIPAAGGDGFDIPEKYFALTDGLTSANTYKTSSTDLVQLISVGPVSLGINDVDTSAFAILAGNTFIDIQDAVSRATSVPTDVPNDGSGNRLPDKFTLYQNYPNPFNPTTTISFELDRKSDYSITIINTLGRTVEIINGNASAGLVVEKWNAEGYASGVYFYKVQVGDQSESKMMLLLK